MIHTTTRTHQAAPAIRVKTDFIAKHSAGAYPDRRTGDHPRGKERGRGVAGICAGAGPARRLSRPCSASSQRPGKAQLVAVRIGEVEEPLAPLGVARRSM